MITTIDQAKHFLETGIFLEGQKIMTGGYARRYGANVRVAKSTEGAHKTWVPVCGLKVGNLMLEGGRLTVQSTSRVRLGAYLLETICGGRSDSLTAAYQGADLNSALMVMRATNELIDGMQVTCHVRAGEEFLRTYWCGHREGDQLGFLTTVTISGIEGEASAADWGILHEIDLIKESDSSTIKELAKRITGILDEALSEKSLKLYSIDLRFGRDGYGNIVLASSFLDPCWDIRDLNGNQIGPLQLLQMLVPERWSAD